MKKMMIFAALLVSQIAHADGFVCQNETGDLNIKIYNHTEASEGTRNASIMVLSDPRISYGRKTIAKFTSVNSTLTSSASVFEANVDLRFNDTGLVGKNIGGTKLGELDRILVAVGFSYNSATEAGDKVPGQIRYVKRNGENWTQSLVCARYLKN